ncbi:sodium- and chloride-dependent glycine transporter 1-like isoform X3 [Crassostrea virginica]
MENSTILESDVNEFGSKENDTSEQKVSSGNIGSLSLITDPMKNGIGGQDNPVFTDKESPDNTGSLSLISDPIKNGIKGEDNAGFKLNGDGPRDVSAPFTLVRETMADDKEILQRGNWGGKLEFILTCVGYAVGLGNVWRFPYLAFKNGGGAFLIPYWIIQLFVGMPLFFLELCFGQFASLGPLAIWKISPVFKGIGIASVCVSAFIGLYYNVIIGYCFYYFFASMSDPLPWAEELSVNATNTTGSSNMTGINKTMSKSERYFYESLLAMSDGLEFFGNVKWELALCLLLAWVVVMAVLSKGIKSLGKVVYFTAIFPYFLLTALLVRGATLEGASDGIYYYLTPNWDRLTDSNVWSDAATQVFFSLSACSGGLVLMASFNKFDNFCLRDALIVPLIDCLTSFFSGFVIFTVLGAMAKAKGVEVADVATGGTGLAFIVYPEAISQMPAPTVWAILFFFMMLIIGFSSQFSIMETVISSIIDEFPEVLRKNWNNSTLFRLAICITFYLLALPMTTNGGIYLLEVLDSSVSGFPLLFVGLFECIALCYVYGYNRLASDIEMMLGKKPWFYWRACWCFITPSILFAVVIFKSYQYTPLTFGDYNYPDWGIALWWVVCMIPILAIPGWATYRCIAVGVKAFPGEFRPSPEWGPASAENRTGRYAQQVPTEKNGVPSFNKANYEPKRWDKDIERHASYGNLKNVRSPHVHRDEAAYKTERWDKDMDRNLSYVNLRDTRSPHVHRDDAAYETKRWDKELDRHLSYVNIQDARSPQGKEEVCDEVQEKKYPESTKL